MHQFPYQVSLPYFYMLPLLSFMAMKNNKCCYKTFNSSTFCFTSFVFIFQIFKYLFQLRSMTISHASLTLPIIQ